jgi:NAD(P)-dependent dehydrogenase (short-subunit alcohol dehydrogenase family)
MAGQGYVLWELQQLKAGDRSYQLLPNSSVFGVHCFDPISGRYSHDQLEYRRHSDPKRQTRCRHHAAIAKIQSRFPAAKISYETLDLASLASVAAFAQRFAAAHSSLDLLINNAGVMALPTRQTTTDGFEMQFGTNYLGHYALTAQLLPLLRRGHEPRVVNLSSIAHRTGFIHFSDLQGERLYSPWKAYNQSKLAMLMFALELQRRSDAGSWNLMSNAAHPGWARTDLITNGPGSGLFSFASQFVAPLLSHSAENGALPILFAATSPDARNGGYYGPNGLYELKGSPALATIMPQARDRAAAAKLWDISGQLTRVSFDRHEAA